MNLIEQVGAVLALAVVYGLLVWVVDAAAIALRRAVMNSKATDGLDD